MKRILFTSIISFLTLFLLSVVAPSNVIAYSSGEGFNYDLFQQFLDEYSKKDSQIGGFTLTAIDYKRIQGEKGSSDSLYRKVLSHFAEVNLAKFSSREEKIAFWINAYNIGAVKMIIDHYPVDSIRSRNINFFKNPWNIKILSIGGSDYALGQIEHDILLGELAEPKAHFGVVCASLSCPNLSTDVFRPDTVMNQLDDLAKKFLIDKKKGLLINRDKNEAHFSKIFKFDKKTFPDGAKTAITLFADHFDPTDLKYLQNSKYKIKYLEYNWALNEGK